MLRSPRMLTVGQFRAARAALRWSQAGTAKHLGVDPSTVQRWEQGAIDAIVPARAEILARVIDIFRAHGVIFTDQAQTFSVHLSPRRARNRSGPRR